jgi:glycosyltransferase involved in cell wall biosynthesis
MMPVLSPAAYSTGSTVPAAGVCQGGGSGIINDRRQTPRPIRYIHTSGQGLSNGRNWAINHGQGEIIAFTDDDCEVPPNWLREIARAFSSECRIGLVFGSVKAGPHDAKPGQNGGSVQFTIGCSADQLMGQFGRRV